ncbi:hypothetical protein F5J12DRAFT_783787 [Pisolithus orientalis]|uniref:uncharacterized protein n=1 Tax=Pisolithus orientalis TaxID=936130 RepID=UPI0022244B5B|nr:uncharacterized protein F5J12DRAFT_783787 [Pisolithus orientalis]KAI6002615.1 hypothetical protein F5J12DRAFT_783787 [Pisolithus orientalis]
MPWKPKDAIANFQYYGLEELLHDSALELMLVTACLQGGQVPEEASQQFNRGNIALLPQDLSALSNVLPPTQSNLQGAIVRCIIEWLTLNNEWYMKKGITFSPENLVMLVKGSNNVGVLQGIEITHLWDGDKTTDAGTCMDWSTLASDLVTEMVTYMDGDHSEWPWHAMKATALAHALNHKSFLDATFPFICWNILQKRAARCLGGGGKYNNVGRETGEESQSEGGLNQGEEGFTIVL